MGLPPVTAGVQFSHDDVAPASGTGVPGTPGTDGVDSVPLPGGSVVEPDGVVVVGDDVGTEPGSPYASLFGDNVPALVTTLSVDAEMIAVITCAGVADGRADKYRAASPATCGAAMDVPDRVAVAVGDVVPAETIPEPGAKRSRHAPKLEYDARTSVMVVAPTVRPDALFPPGDVVHASTFELPAADTTVMPSLYARSTADSNEALLPVPKLKLITAGPET